MPPTEVFLSHSSHDHAVAHRLATVVAAHGVPVFYSPQNIVGAQQWQDEILHALQRCEWFVVLLSPEAVKSMWVRREVSLALRETRYENKIIPLNYRACEMASVQWLTLFQMVDFSHDFADGCRNLLRVWGLGLRPELVAPANP